MKIELNEIINALDVQTKFYIESSAQRCIERSGNEILIEDILYTMLEKEDSLFNKLLEHYEIDVQEMHNQLQKSSKTTNTESKNPIFSTMLVQWLEEAFYTSKMSLALNKITESSLILSLFDNSVKYSNTSYFKLIKNINTNELKELILGLNEKKRKNTTKQKIETNELDKYTTNLTKLAKEGKIDPVLCRDDEIKQAVDILLRRRKNNPILVGEAGVGKTAVVEGLALKIINKEVPNYLYEAQILSLDLGALQAGASVKGEFERRLQAVIKEIQSSTQNIILFIDEAHTLIGAGGNEGGGDAANLLKPALARGELKTIAATTWLEYRKYFEKDPALSRRFQKINLLEPSVEQAITILRGLSKKYEDVHNVYIEDDALRSAAILSARYITGRQLPDKAIDVLDTACANVKISKTNIPHTLQKINTEIIEKQREIDFLKRDHENEIKDYQSVILILQEDLKELEREREVITNLWNEQKLLLNKIYETKDKEELSLLNIKLNQLQKEYSYIYKNVTKEQVAEVIASWTGIPLGNMVQEQIKNIMKLEDNMKERIIGQNEAISYLTTFLQISMAGLKKEDAPNGVFLLVGPSGVGKTETARAIADLMYGGERFITTINMTEFQEKHTVSRLIGSPPGYVGYGDGGQLTDPVRIKPYSVVLLDEIEKAHPDILNLFYQIFDKGVANDGEGRVIDFKNTTIIMTSNLATEKITELCVNTPNLTMDFLTKEIAPTLSSYLQPALLGRMNVIPYFNLKDESLLKIANLKLDVVKKQLMKKNISLQIDNKLLEYIVTLSNAVDTGARNIDLIININIMPKLSKYILNCIVNNIPIDKLSVSINLDNEILISHE
ncbi:type VI secretion system ATPase TssH [Arcobacter sp. F2176]|uniref:type VI secretion system ATPase TssH n=1 Tax=Arcobacter sp. F2176 TaxID=2044511 RepID=UPI00100AE998|nr:type VI secretion system ATPase TssH [Arcobacter sp. F2176]RXJ82687.1 type VI secretion system ATPase TssH [Arcobacter sp. F2176]